MLKPEYEWGEKRITLDNPIKLRLKLAWDNLVSGSAEAKPLEPNPHTGEQVILHPRFGLPYSGHWHEIPAAGREVMVREHDILHIRDAEGKVTERIEIAVFPVAQQENP